MDSLELNEVKKMAAEKAIQEVDRLHPGFFEPFCEGEEDDKEYDYETNENRIDSSLDPSSSNKKKKNSNINTFDAVRESLKEIPRDFSTKDLRREEERLMAIVEAVQTRINGEIYKRRNDIGSASKQILDIQDDLTRTKVIIRNGRRALETSKNVVDMKVQAVYASKRRDNMIKVVRVVEELRKCSERELSIREKIEKGDIAGAIVEYGEAKRALESLSDLNCVKQATEDLNLLKFEVERGTRDALVFAFSSSPINDDEDAHLLYENAFQGALALGHERAAELSAECFATARDTMLSNSRANDPVGEISSASHLLFKRLHFAKKYHEKRIAIANKTDTFDTLLADSLTKSNLEARMTDTAYHALNALEMTIRSTKTSTDTSPDVARMTLRKCRLFADMCEKFAGAKNVCSRTKSLMDCAIDVLSDAQRKPILEKLKLAFEREAWLKIPDDLARKARAEARMASSIEERLLMDDNNNFQNESKDIDWLSRCEHPFSGNNVVDCDDAILKMTTNDQNLPLSPQDSQKSNGHIASAEEQESSSLLSAEDPSTSKTVTTSTALLLESVRVFASLAAESPMVTSTNSSKCRSKVKAFDACREMFELALFNVFVSFGNPRLLVHDNGAPGQQQAMEDHNIDAMTNRLKQTLTKLTSRGGHFALKPPPPPPLSSQHHPQLRQQGQKTENGNMATTTTTTTLSSSNIVAPSTTSQVSKLSMSFKKRSNVNARVQIASSGNMFGLKERVVAIESLACVASIYEELKPTFERWVGNEDSSSSTVDKFFAKVVYAVDDLREHVLSRVAELLLDVSWLPDEIGDSDFKITDMQSMKKAALGKYNQKEMPSVLSASDWTTQLGQVLTQFATILRVSEVTAVNGKVLWELGAQLVSNAIVRGFAKVKKCSVDGRAIMQMDVQTVQQHFQTHYPFEAGLNLDFRFVETYIKAFYTPEQEIVRWTMIHPEYTREQKMVLVAHVAHAFKWTTKQKADCLAEIQESDLV